MSDFCVKIQSGDHIYISKYAYGLNRDGAWIHLLSAFKRVPGGFQETIRPVDMPANVFEALEETALAKVEAIYGLKSTSSRD